jgi:hypothetical protein
MLVHRLTTILPAMMLPEALETTRLYRIAGRTGARTALVPTRPFRALHLRALRNSRLLPIPVSRCARERSGLHTPEFAYYSTEYASTGVAPTRPCG